jgi:hypothetical protein
VGNVFWNQPVPPKSINERYVRGAVKPIGGFAQKISILCPFRLDIKSPFKAIQDPLANKTAYPCFGIRIIGKIALEPQGVRQINGYFLHISSNKHTQCIPAGENKQVLKIQAYSVL